MLLPLGSGKDKTCLSEKEHMPLATRLSSEVIAAIDPWSLYPCINRNLGHLYLPPALWIPSSTVPPLTLTSWQHRHATIPPLRHLCSRNWALLRRRWEGPPCPSFSVPTPCQTSGWLASKRCALASSAHGVQAAELPCFYMEHGQVLPIPVTSVSAFHVTGAAQGPRHV